MKNFRKDREFRTEEEKKMRKMKKIRKIMEFSVMIVSTIFILSCLNYGRVVQAAEKSPCDITDEAATDQTATDDPTTDYIYDLDPGEVYYAGDEVQVVPGHHYEMNIYLKNDFGHDLHAVAFKQNGGLYLLDPEDDFEQIQIAFQSPDFGDAGVQTEFGLCSNSPAVFSSEGDGVYKLERVGTNRTAKLLPGTVGGLKGAEIGTLAEGRAVRITSKWRASSWKSFARSDNQSERDATPPRDCADLPSPSSRVRHK